MWLNRIIQYFVPKDRIFFPLFEQAGKNLLSMSGLLSRAVVAQEASERENLFREIENLEHTGDEITHEIYTQLGKNFITPFDREDIHALTSAIDDVADYIHGSANRMLLYKVTTITPPIRKLADLIQQGCMEIDKAVRELPNLRNIEKIASACVHINSLENQADEIFARAVADLFEHEKDAIVLIKYKEVLSTLETATDMCEDVADVLESILVKNA